MVWLTTFYQSRFQRKIQEKKYVSFISIFKQNVISRVPFLYLYAKMTGKGP